MEVDTPRSAAPARAPDQGIRFEEHAELPENDGNMFRICFRGDYTRCVQKPDVIVRLNSKGVNDQKDPAFEEFKLAMENLERFDLVNIIEEIFEKSTKKTEAILRSALDGFGPIFYTLFKFNERVKAVVKTKVREGEAGDEADADSSGSEKSKDEEIFRTDLANLNYFAPVNLDDFLGEMTDSGGDEDDSDAEIMDSDSDNSDYEEGKSVPNSSSDLNGRDQRSTHRSPRGNNATGEGKRTR
eukprot:89732-Amorphochlora_amoeboformis.AAC.1